jgi:hypothetical protein
MQLQMRDADASMLHAIASLAAIVARGSGSSLKRETLFAKLQLQPLI